MVLTNSACNVNNPPAMLSVIISILQVETLPENVTEMFSFLTPAFYICLSRIHSLQVVLLSDTIGCTTLFMDYYLSVQSTIFEDMK